MAEMLVKFTLTNAPYVYRFDNPNFQITEVERMQCGGRTQNPPAPSYDFCTSGSGTPSDQTSLDTNSKTETSGSILKATDGDGNTVLEVILPSDAFATKGRLKLTVPTNISGMQVSAKLIGDIV